MVRKTKEEAQATRDSILQAATEVFHEQGVAKAGLETIAERAGVTRGAIYWHFKNKASIFEALHDKLHQSLMEIILEDLERDHPHPLKQLEELCISLLLDIHHEPEKRKVLEIFFLKCDYSGDMAPFLSLQRDNKAKHKELFSRYFRRAMDKGYLRADTDPNLLTMSLFCYITGIVHEYLRNPCLFNMEEEAPRLMRQLFTGLAQCRKAE